MQADVLTWDRLFAHDAFKALDMVQTVDSRSSAVMRTTRCPIRIDGELSHQPGSQRRASANGYNEHARARVRSTDQLTMGAWMKRTDQFRIAVRKYAPFEQAIRAQWEAFEATADTGLTLDLVALDLHSLEEALFTTNGMRNGDWDVAFIATDWIASVHAQGCAIDLAPLLASDPPEDYPHGWTDSLLRLQRIGTSVLGVPYHDGPECLIVRRDLFDDPELQSALYDAGHGQLSLPPTTWADFHRIARFFHGRRPGLSGTVFAAFPDGHNSVYDFLLQLWTRGGDLFDSAGRIHFATPEAAEALTFYRAILADRDRRAYPIAARSTPSPPALPSPPATSP